MHVSVPEMSSNNNLDHNHNKSSRLNLCVYLTPLFLDFGIFLQNIDNVGKFLTHTQKLLRVFNYFEPRNVRFI